MHFTIMLVGGDSPYQQEQFKIAIQNSKYRVVKEVMYGEEALACYEKINPSIVVVDLGVSGNCSGSGPGGLNLIKKIIEMDEKARVIATYTEKTAYLVMRAIKDGAISQVGKPYKRQEILDALINAFISKSGEESVRRQSVRMGKLLPVSYKLSRAGFFAKMKPAFSDDISVEGMGFRSKEKIAKGIELKIKIKFPGLKEIVKVEAQVMRSKKVLGSSMYEIGVLFTKIDKKNRKVIRRFVTDIISS